MILTTLALAACSGAVDSPARSVPSGDPEHGLEVMSRVGCGSCHAIPGIDWPEGRVGPSLDGLGRRALIGSGLPNRPETLIPYLVDAPSVDEGSPMPPMPISEEEARDIAAYLYGL
ncbi:c-type cytochrome [Brevundimonas sp.]|uniref:c-type cytochrome n=1 Tax=Brevundimonas sp. TaxID=1871086 RepID=UPI001D37AAB7|nr:c-type cytochrome [Brevundimonas sp.]MBA4000525.1 cytochrome C [Brevundimonas sp.]